MRGKENTSNNIAKWALFISIMSLFGNSYWNWVQSTIIDKSNYTQIAMDYKPEVLFAKDPIIYSDSLVVDQDAIFGRIQTLSTFMDTVKNFKIDSSKSVFLIDSLKVNFEISLVNTGSEIAKIIAIVLDDSFSGDDYKRSISIKKHKQR